MHILSFDIFIQNLKNVTKVSFAIIHIVVFENVLESVDKVIKLFEDIFCHTLSRVVHFKIAPTVFVALSIFSYDNFIWIFKILQDLFLCGLAPKDLHINQILDCFTRIALLELMFFIFHVLSFLIFNILLHEAQKFFDKLFDITFDIHIFIS